MSRIPYVRREELGPEGQQLWDGIVSGQSDLVLTTEGGLAGPFNAFVTAPGAGRRLSALGAKLRFGTSIERRLSEIAIITIGARWQAEFEWWAHAPMAREHGVSDAVVDAIGRGEDPPFEAEDERAVYAVAREFGHDDVVRLLHGAGIDRQGCILAGMSAHIFKHATQEQFIRMLVIALPPFHAREAQSPCDEQDNNKQQVIKPGTFFSHRVTRSKR